MGGGEQCLQQSEDEASHAHVTQYAMPHATCNNSEAGNREL